MHELRNRDTGNRFPRRRAEKLIVEVLSNLEPAAECAIQADVLTEGDLRGRTDMQRFAVSRRGEASDPRYSNPLQSYHDPRRSPSVKVGLNDALLAGSSFERTSTNYFRSSSGKRLPVSIAKLCIL